jgi:aspartyl-tRNA(Asn)/glutamyl-tRNA(Gln) amidotransferase subunit B
MRDHWEPVIGLEIHAELNTKSKLFSTDVNRFGDEPNTNLSELAVALPGSLPVLNKEAVRKAIQFGLAVRGEVQLFSRFDRKSYFYPDCPRNYQITQYDYPIVRGGSIVALVGKDEKEFSINRIQLEDDAGMLKHFSTFAGIDFNRAGVPLIEIVSEPCMHSCHEAVAYAMAIRSLLDYLDASDCNMEEGSIRFDVNISVRKKGEKGLRNRSEIKNMNSFSNLQIAIDHEIEKQIRIYEENPDKDPALVHEQSTYRFDPETNRTVLMRSKEDAEDYRYFPDPDLLPLVLKEEDIEKERVHLPELPLQKERRYANELGLSPQLCYFLTAEKKLANYFEEALKTCTFPKQLANWIAVEFIGRFKEKGISLWQSGILPSHIAELVTMIQEGTVTGKIAKSVADDMVTSIGKSPKEIVENNPSYRPFQDGEKLKEIVQEVLQENEPSVTSFLQGRDRAFAFLVGQVMKKTQGSAPPEEVNRLLKEGIEKRKL